MDTSNMRKAKRSPMDFQIADVEDMCKSVNYYRTGFMDIKRQRYEQALSIFEDALKRDPANIEAHYGIGTVFIHLQRYKEAVEELDKVLEIFKDYADAWQNKAYALYKLGRHTEAVKCARMQRKSARRAMNKRHRFTLRRRAILFGKIVAILAASAVVIWGVVAAVVWLDINYIPVVESALTSANYDEPIISIRNGEAEIAAEDILYDAGDTIFLDVTIGGEHNFKTKYHISSISLSSPQTKELYFNAEAGFGQYTEFWEDTDTDILYGESDTVRVDFTLDESVAGTEKQTVEFEISYVYATVVGESHTFEEGVGSEIVSVEICPVKYYGEQAYLLHDPENPRLEVALALAKSWEELMVEQYSPNGEVTLYRGCSNGRYDFVADNGVTCVSSFEGSGYDAFGDEKPLFDAENRAIFCARRDEKWCLVFGEAELPFHQSIAEGSIRLLEDGRVAYIAVDGDAWSVLIASPQGGEFPIFSLEKETGKPKEYVTLDASAGRFLFVVSCRGKRDGEFIVYSNKKAADIIAETAPEAVAMSPLYHSIAVRWFSEEDELVYIAQKEKGGDYAIYIDGRERPFDEAQEYLLSQLDGYADANGNNSAHDELESKLRAYEQEFALS